MSFAGTPTACAFALLFPCNSPSCNYEIFLCTFLSCSFIVVCCGTVWSALGFCVSPPLFPVCTVSLDVLCTLQHFQSLIMARPLTLWDPLLLDIYFAMPTRVWTDTHQTQFHLLWGSTSTRCCILVCSS